jgi:hypothetical protein
VFNVAIALPLSATVPMMLVPSRNVTVPVGAPPADVVTVAVNVTAWPPIKVFREEATAVEVDRVPTVSESAAEFVGAKFASPEYCAVMGCAPTDSEEIFNVARPLALTVPVPMGTPLSKKLTVPEGAPALGLLTVAESMTCWPKTGEICDEPRVAVVPAVPADSDVA